jgi:hypothetical protein
VEVGVVGGGAGGFALLVVVVSTDELGGDEAGGCVGSFLRLVVVSLVLDLVLTPQCVARLTGTTWLNWRP